MPDDIMPDAPKFVEHDMGEDSIPLERREGVIRAIRHNVKGIMGVQGSQQDLIRFAMNFAIASRDQAAAAQETARLARDKADANRELIGELTHDIFGNPDRPDMGSLASSMKTLKYQQWAIFVLLLGAIASALLAPHIK